LNFPFFIFLNFLFLLTNSFFALKLMKLFLDLFFLDFLLTFSLNLEFHFPNFKYYFFSPFLNFLPFLSILINFSNIHLLPIHENLSINYLSFPKNFLTILSPILFFSFYKPHQFLPLIKNHFSKQNYSHLIIILSK
jgi:hypothetical protein